MTDHNQAELEKNFGVIPPAPAAAAAQATPSTSPAATNQALANFMLTASQRKKKKIITVSLQPSIIAEIDEYIKNFNSSRSHFIEEAIKAFLSK